MVPTDHEIPFQGVLRLIFKEFSRIFFCSFKHPFAKKLSTMDFSNKTKKPSSVIFMADVDHVDD